MLKSKKAICMVTGASQHLGSHIAQALAQEVAPGSILILTSRSIDRLQKIRDDIHKNFAGKVHVHMIQWDLRSPDADQYERDLKRALDGSKIDSYDVALAVHNAASLGEMSRKVEDMRDVKELQDQLNINLVSMLVLNSVWLHLVKNAKKKVVVNMTSPSATSPKPSLGLSTMVKSSRQMTLNVLAKESHDVHVLNFDPGLVDTGSLRSIRDEAHSKEIREWIGEFYAKSELLDPDHVANLLLQIVDEGKYESGAYMNAFQIK